jgi:hypothetical protein
MMRNDEVAAELGSLFEYRLGSVETHENTPDFPA